MCSLSAWFKIRSRSKVEHRCDYLEETACKTVYRPCGGGSALSRSGPRTKCLLEPRRERLNPNVVVRK